MENNFKHLYIHIPFCKYICTYCDFVRKIPKNESEIFEYIQKIIYEINKINHKLKTIYIGGGTPNYLPDEILDKLLNSLQKNIDSETEFTIECNPDFVNNSQVDVLAKNNVNRISLGVQTTNNKILKLLNRKHTIQDVVNSINLFKQKNINNISCDFIYNLPLLKNNDIQESIKFCVDNDIKHISFYSLEIKEGSIMNKMKYKIDDESEFSQLIFLKNQLNKTKFKRYEISNWSISEEFRSKHNLAYWKMDDWRGIGIGAFGLENRDYYFFDNNYENFSKQSNHLNTKEYYQYILIMGLRLVDGIDLNIKKNNEAFNFFKNKLNVSLLKIYKNKLMAKNIDLLNEILLDII